MVGFDDRFHQLQCFLMLARSRVLPPVHVRLSVCFRDRRTEENMQLKSHSRTPKPMRVLVSSANPMQLGRHCIHTLEL